MSIAIENFVKNIYHFRQRNDGLCKIGKLAKKLKVSNAAATDMARKLSRKGLLDYEKYRGISLTEDGYSLAIKVIRKHRLWETFLYKNFGMSLHEVHIEAEGLEHSTSDFLAEKLNKYLGYPTIDPHGDPIPTAEGVVAIDNDFISLSKGEVGKTYKIVRLVSDDKDFLDFCADSDMLITHKLIVKKQHLASKMTEIEAADKKLIIHDNYSKLIHLHEYQ